MTNARRFFSATAVSLLLLAPLGASAETSPWILDASHSRIGFTVPHLVISSVSGYFKNATATIALDESNLTKSQVEITIDAKSIDTAEPKRDEHLRGADFFDVAKYPVIVFDSTKVTAAGGQKYKLTGQLTMHGVTKPVTLDGTISDAVKNPWGKTVRAVKLTGKLKRSDFGLTWNKALETGGVVVGDTVTLDIQVEINK